MNPYVIILGVFTLAGFAMAVWGWRMLAAARRARRWLSITGTVNAAAPDGGDEPPRIVVGYAVDDHRNHAALRRPLGGDAWLSFAIGVGAALFGLGAMFLRG